MGLLQQDLTSSTPSRVYGHALQEDAHLHRAGSKKPKAEDADADGGRRGPVEARPRLDPHTPEFNSLT